MEKKVNKWRDLSIKKKSEALIDREKKINYKEFTGVDQKLMFRGSYGGQRLKHKLINLLKRNIDLSKHLIKPFYTRKKYNISSEGWVTLSSG